jgi:hypothetical protein
MLRDYKHEAAIEFVRALRDEDNENARSMAELVTRDPNAVNYGVAPDKEYNDAELADLIEANLKGIDEGRWDMTNAVYLPKVIGAVLYWLNKDHGEDDGKTSSESFEQSTEQDAPGA